MKLKSKTRSQIVDRLAIAFVIVFVFVASTLTFSTRVSAAGREASSSLRFLNSSKLPGLLQNKIRAQVASSCIQKLLESTGASGGQPSDLASMTEVQTDVTESHIDAGVIDVFYTTLLSLDSDTRQMAVVQSAWYSGSNPSVEDYAIVESIRCTSTP